MRCLHCRQSAQVSGFCVSHAMRDAVERGDHARAYALAREYSRPESAVRVLIRSAMERREMAEAAVAIAAGRAMASTPTVRAAVTAMRTATREMLVAVSEMPARAA
jgi:hypothetical protein